MCVFCILCCVPLIISWWGHITRWNKHQMRREGEGERRKNIWKFKPLLFASAPPPPPAKSSQYLHDEKWNNGVFVVFYWKLSTIYCNVNNINFVIAIRTVEWTTGWLGGKLAMVQNMAISQFWFIYHKKCRVNLPWHKLLSFGNPEK